jgi:hypothetical protein
MSAFSFGLGRLAYKLRVEVTVERDVCQGRSVGVEVSQRSELLVQSLDVSFRPELQDSIAH